MSEFSVKGIPERIDNSALPSASRKTNWFSCLPRKINICGWRVVGNRLPTRTNLATKGIDIPSTICPLCNDGSETVIHVFGECTSVKKIWDLIERWLNMKLPALRFPTDLMEWAENLALSVPKKEMVGAIIYVAWWQFGSFEMIQFF
ncbi:uncharacterized protein LOC143601998 [Bidens hawaiensis]|uniref:uncharacterized protein LOC143601998 n=1 Tax=Bidens hawaiensis TaxID=980011 RepID=UPI00404AABC9